MKFEKVSSNISIFLLFFLALYIINCSKDNPTGSIESTIISGNAKMDLNDGFDFSTNDTIKINYFNLESSQQVNQVDILIYCPIRIIGDPWKFVLIGSTVLMTNPWGQGYWAGPDSSMPAIKLLNVNKLDDITEVSEGNFQLSLEVLSENLIYAVKTQDEKYAILEITKLDTLTDIPNFSFNWKYQSNGSRNFK
ncbi:MAG: hypothetical protein ACE5JB_16260 [bacterium]